jgi:hypothetical protein
MENRIQAATTGSTFERLQLLRGIRCKNNALVRCNIAFIKMENRCRADTANEELLSSTVTWTEGYMLTKN